MIPHEMVRQDFPQFGDFRGGPFHLLDCQANYGDLPQLGDLLCPINCEFLAAVNIRYKRIAPLSFLRVGSGT